MIALAAIIATNGIANVTLWWSQWIDNNVGDFLGYRVRRLLGFYKMLMLVVSALEDCLLCIGI